MCESRANVRDREKERERKRKRKRGLNRLNKLKLIYPIDLLYSKLIQWRRKTLIKGPLKQLLHTKTSIHSNERSLSQ